MLQPIWPQHHQLVLNTAAARPVLQHCPKGGATAALLFVALTLPLCTKVAFRNSYHAELCGESVFVFWGRATVNSRTVQGSAAGHCGVRYNNIMLLDVVLLCPF